MEIREKTTLTLGNFREIPSHDCDFNVEAGDVLFEDKGMRVEIIEPYGITNDYRLTYKGNCIEFYDFLVEDGKFTSRLDMLQGEVKPIRAFFENNRIQTRGFGENDYSDDENEYYIAELCCYLYDLYQVGYPRS